MEQTEYTITEIAKNVEKPGIQLLADGRLVLCFADDNKRCNSDCPGFEFVKWHEGGEDRVILHCLEKREIRLAKNADVNAKEPAKEIDEICGTCGHWSKSNECLNPKSPNFKEKMHTMRYYDTCWKWAVLNPPQ